MSTIEALIFDLDGTLADSISDIGTAMNAVLEELGLSQHSMTAYKQFVGEGAENLVRRSIRASQGLDWCREDDRLLPEAMSIKALTDRYREQYARLDHSGSSQYPGVAEMLDGVVAAGKPMAVLSNKRDDFTKGLIARAFGRWTFHDVRGEREGVPRKPDATAALELAASLRVQPSRIGFVGDTAIDMHTARNAGMIPLGALWGFRDRAELEAAGATQFLPTPAALLPLLEGQVKP